MNWDRTYFAMDPDGTFRETQRGRESWTTIHDDIVSGQYEVLRVYRAGPVAGPDQTIITGFEDVSSLMAEAVYETVCADGPGDHHFIPSFLKIHLPGDAQLLAEEWRRHPQLIAAE